MTAQGDPEKTLGERLVYSGDITAVCMFAAAQVYDFVASSDGQIDVVSDANTMPKAQAVQARLWPR